MKHVMLIMCLAASVTLGATPPPEVKLTLEDQFDKKHSVADYRGDVLVLMYGDRKASEPNKALGEKLHVHYHPTAKGLKVAAARQAPVKPLPGLDATKRSPDVQFVAIACTGSIPDLVLGIVKREVKKASPDVPLLFDTKDIMKTNYGIRDGEPNLIVVDAEGKLRFRVLGEMDEKTYGRLIEVIDYLRTEAVSK